MTRSFAPPEPGFVLVYQDGRLYPVATFGPHEFARAIAEARMHRLSKLTDIRNSRGVPVWFGTNGAN